MLDWEDILLRLVIASVLGALIGLERERKNWSAGLRTHMVVCVGACLIMIVSAYGFQDILGANNIVLDPSRVAAQVVSGIGFLGAGTIIFQKSGTVRGLTTAAGIWTVAGIGLAVGGGLYLAASITTALILIILWGLQPLEKKYSKHANQQTLRITITTQTNDIALINNMLNQDISNIELLNFTRNESNCIFEIKFDNIENSRISYLLEKLRHIQSVEEVVWNQN